MFSDTGGQLKATFIDNTHLFGGPRRSGPDRNHRLSAAEMVALSAAEEHRQLDRWTDAIRQTMPGALSSTLNLLPEEWQDIQARDASFEDRFTTRLERLDDLVHSALDRARSFAPAFRSRFFCVLPEDEAPSELPLV